MLARLLDGWSSLVEAYYSKQFGSAERIQFYESLTALLENGVGVNDALNEIRTIYNDDGRQRYHPIALACADIGEKVGNGKKLAESCNAWVPYQEMAIIGAGERSGNLTQAFSDCIRLIEAHQKIQSLILSSALYPAITWTLMAYLLHIIATRVVPAMARSTPPEHMTGTSYLLYLIATYVNHYGLITLIALIVLLVGALVSLPYLTGPLRVRLERLPPWSIYKALHGSTFLLNIAVMLRANINQVEALDALMINATPWLRERLLAVSYGVEIGKNFGVALKLAGHEFPDKTAIHFLCVLATRKSFADAISRFANRWLDTSLKNVELYTKSFLLFSIGAIGSLMILVLIGTYSMQDAISTPLH